MQTTYTYHSSLHDPYFHLGLESYLLNTFPRDEEREYILIYRNRPSIILGRFQNPWAECHIQTFNESDSPVPIVRRMSGGGTVYHDFGNLNFSIITNRKTYDRKDGLLILQKTLKTFGLICEINERFDLHYEGYKISGSAYRQTKAGKLHHFTLLCHADDQLLKKYLHSKGPEILNSQAISSKRSPTKSLHHWMDLSPETVAYSFFENCPQGISLSLNQHELQQIQEHQLKYMDPQWIWAETPKFTLMLSQVNLGHLMCHIEKASVKKIEGVLSDQVHPGLLEQVNLFIKDFKLYGTDDYFETCMSQLKYEFAMYQGWMDLFIKELKMHYFKV